MIVQPDFLDHYKTNMLIDLLEDSCSPLYVIRLWGHCQNRKTHRFPWVNPHRLKAICKAPHNADKFHDAMVETGFVRIDNGETVAHDWDEVNASLLSSWENGKRGGRPKRKTQSKPMGNPSQTQAKPIREEKIDKIEKKEIPPVSPKGGDSKSSDSKPSSQSEHRKRPRAEPPTWDAVYSWALQWAEKNHKDYRAVVAVAKEAFEYYERTNWTDRNGKKVKIWKTKISGNWFSDEKLKRAKVGGSPVVLDDTGGGPNWIP